RVVGGRGPDPGVVVVCLRTAEHAVVPCMGNVRHGGVGGHGLAPDQVFLEGAADPDPDMHGGRDAAGGLAVVQLGLEVVVVAAVVKVLQPELGVAVGRDHGLGALH